MAPILLKNRTGARWPPRCNSLAVATPTSIPSAYPLRSAAARPSEDTLPAWKKAPDRDSFSGELDALLDRTSPERAMGARAREGTQKRISGPKSGYEPMVPMGAMVTELRNPYAAGGSKRAFDISDLGAGSVRSDATRSLGDLTADPDWTATPAATRAFADFIGSGASFYNFASSEHCIPHQMHNGPQAPAGPVEIEAAAWSAHSRGNGASQNTTLIVPADESGETGRGGPAGFSSGANDPYLAETLPPSATSAEAPSERSSPWPAAAPVARPTALPTSFGIPDGVSANTGSAGFNRYDMASDSKMVVGAPSVRSTLSTPSEPRSGFADNPVSPVPQDPVRLSAPGSPNIPGAMADRVAFIGTNGAEYGSERPFQLPALPLATTPPIETGEPHPDAPPNGINGGTGLGSSRDSSNPPAGGKPDRASFDQNSEQPATGSAAEENHAGSNPTPSSQEPNVPSTMPRNMHAVQGGDGSPLRPIAHGRSNAEDFEGISLQRMEKIRHAVEAPSAPGRLQSLSLKVGMPDGTPLQLRILENNGTVRVQFASSDHRFIDDVRESIPELLSQLQSIRIHPTSESRSEVTPPQAGWWGEQSSESGSGREDQTGREQSRPGEEPARQSKRKPLVSFTALFQTEESTHASS